MTEVKIDARMAEVIIGIDRAGGTADTSEVKAVTELDAAEQVKYRFRQLRDAGYLGIERQGTDSTGSPRPLLVSFTDDVEADALVAKAERIYFDSDEHQAAVTEFDDRVTRLEKHNDRLWEKLVDTRQKLREQKERIDQLETNE